MPPEVLPRQVFIIRWLARLEANPMNLLQETLLDRLWDRYVRQFGETPPVQDMSIDETIALMRDALEARRAGAACRVIAGPAPAVLLDMESACADDGAYGQRPTAAPRGGALPARLLSRQIPG